MMTRIATTQLLLLVAAALALAAPPPSAVYNLTLAKGAAGGGDLAVRIVTTQGTVTEGRAGEWVVDVAGVTAGATGLRLTLATRPPCSPNFWYGKAAELSLTG